MTPKERIAKKQAITEKEFKNQLTKNRTERFNNMRGHVRISEYYNQPWRGFVLQRGHLYGQDVDGDYFVSGFQPGKKPNTIIVYAKAEFNGAWEKLELPRDNDLILRIKAALPLRSAMGINQVIFQPDDIKLKHEKIHFPKSKPVY